MTFDAVGVFGLTFYKKFASAYCDHEDNLCLDPIGSNLSKLDLTNFIKLGRNGFFCRKIHKQNLDSKYNLGVSPNFEITVACGLKFHWCLRTSSLKFQKAKSKIDIFLSLPCWLSKGQRRENFNFACSLLKF